MLLLPFEQCFAIQRRVHVAGCDGVDADGVGCPFRGEGFGQLGYGCFGGAGPGGRDQYRLFGWKGQWKSVWREFLKSRKDTEMKGKDRWSTYL